MHFVSGATLGWNSRRVEARIVGGGSGCADDQFA